MIMSANPFRASRIGLQAAVFASLLPSVAYAGACTVRLQLLQDRAITILEETAAQGRSGQESTAATMHREPTPRSMAEAEERLGELPREKVDAFRLAFLRASTADAAGDEAGCHNAAEIAETLLRKP